MNQLVVENAEDWDWLRRQRLMTIVDPMVFRTADLFLAGHSQYNTEAIWGTIDKNIGALASFFDALILRERLPIFSYQVTFPESRLADLGREGDFLVPVFVQGAVYRASRDSALTELNSSKPIPDTLIDEIIDELDAFGYSWYPQFDQNPNAELSPKQKQLWAFLLGGLIFGGYAQQLSRPQAHADHQAEHLLQPKRARLMLAASLGDLGKTTTDETILLRRFKRLAASLPPDALHRVDLPQAPTFLPLLLRHEPRTPRDLLDLALDWRSKPSIRAFREWYRNIEVQLHRDYYPPELEKELQQLRRDIARELGRAPETTITVSAKIGATLVGGDAGLGVERQVEVGRIQWFFQSLLPQYSYRKLFVRMAIAQGRYGDLTKHLGELWYADEKR